MNRPSPNAFLQTVQLVDAAQSGDRQAVETLFARYLPRVRQIVSLRMGRHLEKLVEYDDIAQETLLRIFQGINCVEQKSEGSFRNWVATCVERAIVDSARRTGAKKRGGGAVKRFCEVGSTLPLSSILCGHGPTPSQIVSTKETEKEIERALLDLPDHHREIINLRLFCEMSFSEIADYLEIGSEATARKALHRAVAKLKERLER